MTSSSITPTGRLPLPPSSAFGEDRGPAVLDGAVIAAVVPCHNEADFVGDVIAGIPPLVDYIIVVDDASTDDTSARASEAAAKDPRVRVLRNERNLGVGGATKRGYAEVLANLPDVDVVIKLDGDGQMPLELVGDILDPVVSGGYDYAKGNRFLSAHTLHQMPKVRMVGNFLLTFMTKFASGYWSIFDVQNGMTAIGRRALERLDLEGLYDGYFFENDMLVQLNAISARVKDVPIPSLYGDEVSGVSVSRVAVTFPWLLFLRFWWRVYHKYMLYNLSPVAVFLLAGLPMFTFGVVFSLYLWIRSDITHVATPLGTALIALVTIVLGFQLLLQAIVLDIQESDQLR